MRRTPRAFLLAALLPALAAAEEPCAPVKPCEIPEGAAPPPSEPPADFSAEARQLFALLSCQGPTPAGLDAAAVKEFCGREPTLLSAARAERAPLAALVEKLRPARLPSAVLAPLSEAGLLSALVAYPEARNLTTASPRPAGDPRSSRLKDPARLREFLGAASAACERGGGVGAATGRGSGAGALPALLSAMVAAGLEPLALRYFRVEPAGTLHYLGAGEVAAMEKAGGRSPFASCEIEFVRAGQPGQPRILRHLAADLSDAGTAADPGPLAYLSAKGTFAVLLEEAGPLAGDGFSRLRDLLLKRAAFIASDGSGPTADQVRSAGLTEEVEPLAKKGAVVAVARRP